MTRLLAIVAVALLAVGGVWYYAKGPAVSPRQPRRRRRSPKSGSTIFTARTRERSKRLPKKSRRSAPGRCRSSRRSLRDPNAEAERIKAALKAAGIIGQAAAPAIPEVAALLPEPGVTSEAAIALSYMGREALPPLRDALADDDADRPSRVAAVDREAQGSRAARARGRAAAADCRR